MADSILIFTTDQPEVPSSETTRGVKRTFKDIGKHAVEITVDTLQDNMRRFLDSLNSIISTSPKEIGGLELDEIEIHANIDGKGNIGISGIVGAEFATQGGIKFVLRKKT